MKVIRKEYQQPFQLEPTKLTRIVDTIHERLAQLPGSVLHDHFEVFLAGQRQEEMNTVDDVLQLDNSNRRKIERLVIRCSASTRNAVRPEYEVEVDFPYPRPNPSAPPSTTNVVAISVKSEATAWANRTLSEVEEQVERTWLDYPRKATTLIIVAAVLLLGMLALVISPFISLSPTQPQTRADWLWLKSSDIDRIEAMLKAPVLTDEQVREIFTMQLHNVLDPPKPRGSIPTDQITRTLFLVVPLAVVIVCFLVLLTTCYPAAVFLWGDEIERNARTVQRRKLMWNVITGVLVVGVLSNLFVLGLSFWLPAHS
jgi:hypothetical protein